jgi:hypothetical protein
MAMALRPGLPVRPRHRDCGMLHRAPPLTGLLIAAWLGLCGAIHPLAAADAYRIKPEHPRLLIDDAAAMAKACDGALAEDYAVVKARADAAVRRGAVEFIGNRWAIPEDLMDCGLAFLVERAHGREHQRYADLVVKQWGDGAIIADRDGSHFGYHALAYDWIYDGLTPAQRVRYGDALGGWLRWFTDRPEITLKWGHWEYNQTWGPVHLNIMNARDALTQKLFIGVAIAGSGSRCEADAKAFLDSWNQRIPAECLPAFERMGGVWSESYGHGAYGPVTVIPYAFAAWRSATGIDLCSREKPWAWPVEEPRWVAYTTMPHNQRTAWIGDGDGSPPEAFARAAPMLRDGLSRWYADQGRAWLRERWQRVACLQPGIAATPPDTLPLGYLFRGAGHVYMRSAWSDPDATWAYFGCGPQFAGHARDDVGHFLIGKRGALVSRQGGQGHNDDDFYSGGSLIYNIVTIFDPAEQFRRAEKNENDGGLLRHVYEADGLPHQRGRIVAFANRPTYTYAAADLTEAYSPRKAAAVTRQFLYLRGDREFFVVVDRVAATKPEFRRHFFLHVPSEPTHAGAQCSWLSAPEADGDAPVLSHGRTRLFMRTVLPADAAITVRGGPGQEAWGHPLEPTAQYEHTAPERLKPPRCPWRIEVADPGTGASTVFLHVFELAGEGVSEPTPITLVPPAGIAIGTRWTLTFATTGAPGGTIGGAPLPTAVDVDGQYAGTAGKN